MNELLRSLQRTLDLLEQGKLDLDGLEQATGHAQALYERFVVLRHKARETAVNWVAHEPAARPEEEGPMIRLDTRPPEVAPNQTSLIDAIAESENDVGNAPPTGKTEPVAAPDPVPVAKKKSKAPRPPAEKVVTLADKLEHAPIADLAKAIALSEKFWFTAELFAKDGKRYDQAIKAMNGMGSLQEAEQYLRDEVVAKLPEPPGDGVTTAFTQLLQRRFA